MRHLLTAHAAACSIIKCLRNCALPARRCECPFTRPLIGIAHNMMPIVPARPYLDGVAGLRTELEHIAYRGVATGRMTGLFGDAAG